MRGHLGLSFLLLTLGVKAFCKSLGADEFVDFTKFVEDTKLEERVKEVTKGGAKIVLQCSSSNKAYEQAVGWLGFRGTLVVLGVPKPDEAIAGAKVGVMIGNELTIFGMCLASVSDVAFCS